MGSRENSICIGSFNKKLSILIVEFNSILCLNDWRNNKIQLKIRDIVIYKPIISMSLGIQSY